MDATVLDAGALIAIDRRERRHYVDLENLRRASADLVTHPLVVAQVWRDGRGGQATLAWFLKNVDVRTLNDEFGRRCGELLGKAGADDPVDAAVVLLANDGDQIMTSDPEDIERLVTAAERAVRIVPV